MPPEALLLGVDVGTTATKAGAFYRDGRLAAMAAASYRLNTDGVLAEQDALDWWTTAAQALRQVAAQIDAGAVIAVSVCGQGPSLVAVDAALQPVAPAITWLDQRARDEVRRLSQAAGRPLPGHAFIAKASWLKQHQPEVYAALRWFCQAWDFVAMQLTGKALCSTSAGIAPWDEGWIEAAGLDPEKFPQLCPMGTRLGAVTAQAARATGLPEGMPVIGGISDYFAGLIGTSAVEPGLACDNGGTSQSFNVCWDKAVTAEGVFCIPSFADGHWYVGGPISTTGKALAWWCSNVLGREADDEALLAEADLAPPGSEGLIFLPYLAGERAPHWDPHARGVFFGLALHHQRPHLTRAILEAVAYAICHVIEHIQAGGAQVSEIRVCGGQARSQRWSRIKADASGLRVVVPACTDAPLLGAAVIGGVGAGELADFSGGARQMLRQQQVIEPDAEHHGRYQELFAVYRDLYAALRPHYQRLQGLDQRQDLVAAV
jgi:xylulokinase